jgi:beta-fructofuranosidase
MFLQSLIASAGSAAAEPLLPSTRQRFLAAGNPANNDRSEFFYRVDGAWCGDFIPFFADDTFHLFYLLDWRDKAAHGEGTPWYQVTTKDFVHFEDRGEMLPRGTREQQDLYVFTGSVIQGEGQYHIFYTGNNQYFRPLHKPEQAVMHAVSTDLMHWTKVPQDTMYAPTAKFEADDWRDPFVFWNSNAGEYWMLLAARLKQGPAWARGCTALCASKDLKKWEVRDPLYSPGLYYTHECPDLFRIGDWWYLIFSEFSDINRTRYRMSRSPSGPWLTPDVDYFDARAFYAAKTAQKDDRRYLFGWTPTRSGGKDYYQWDWGGSLIVHELQQQPDGSLAVRIPATVEEAFSKPLSPAFTLRSEKVRAENGRLAIAALGTFGYAVSRELPNCCKLRARIRFDEGTRQFGVMLRTSENLDASYYFRFEPHNHRLVFDCVPRTTAPDQRVTIEGGYMPGLERYVNLEPGKPVDLTILVDHTIAVIYVNDQSAMTVRMYNLASGGWGFFVQEGNAQVSNISVSTLA